MEYAVTILMTGFVTHDVKRFVVSRPEGLAYRPGQGVEIAIDQPGWRDKGRPFTPTSLVDDRVMEFTIKGYPDHHGVTERLHTLAAGDRLLMSAAFGTISYQGPGVFIAGGAGITPFLAIIRQLARDGSLEGHSLIFSNKGPADIICEKELRHRFGGNATFLCTREASAQCEQVRIDREFLRSRIGRFDQRFYVCGPKAFVRTVNDTLTELGATPDAVVFER